MPSFFTLAGANEVSKVLAAISDGHVLPNGYLSSLPLLELVMLEVPQRYDDGFGHIDPQAGYGFKFLEDLG
jgi:hypothetical protein